jgi:hypothetical protein
VIIVEVRSAIFSRFECGKRPPQPSARKPLEPVSKVPTSILDSDGPLSETGSGRSAAAAGTAVHVQGFGYRPVDDLSVSAEGRCPKAFREGTRGGGGGGLLSMGICRGSVLGRGCTGRRNGRRTDDRGRDFVAAPAVGGVFLPCRGRRTRPGRPPVNSAAMPEARFPGRWVVR